MEYLTTQRGLKLDTLELFRVGIDSDRITIPIRYRGKWRAGPPVHPERAPEGKSQDAERPGFGTSLLAYAETLSWQRPPVVATAGEFDAMLRGRKPQDASLW